MRMSRGLRAAKIIAAVLVILLALIVTLPTVFGLSDQFLRHGSCVPNGTIATGWDWTPIAIADSPPTYNNTTEWAQASGWTEFEPPALFNVSGGAAGGMFSLDYWQLVRLHIAWTWGPGSVMTCSNTELIDASPDSLGSAESWR